MASAPTDDAASDGIEIDAPTLADAPALWQAAQAAGGLDVNPLYAYVLWCRDFAATTAVARMAGEVVGYCTAYRRPDVPTTLFVWQIAVLPAARRRGLGQRILHHLVDRDARLTALEATVTHDNAASLAMFATFARQRGSEVTVSPLFGHEHLGADHEPEDLLHIPLR